MTIHDIQALGYAIPQNVLTELVCRFTSNIPEDEKAELVRVCWQVELAHWFFVDNYCQPGSELDHLTHIPFDIFTLQMFEATPYLHAHLNKVDKAVSEFKAYKNKVPVYGAILLTRNMEEVLLVQGFRSQWGFPKGKINKEEDELLCAIREVLEETGYDTKDLVNKDHYIESSQNDRVTRLYIIVGVERDFSFRPRTAYEIREISWFSLDELPEHRKDLSVTPRQGYSNANFYTVFSYVRRLKRWIADKLDGSNKIQNFKISETHGKTPNLENIQFPNFPLRPAFATGVSSAPPALQIVQPPYFQSLLGSPPHGRNQVKRKLDFDNALSPQQRKPEQPVPAPPFQRTSLSLAMLFGNSAAERLSGFDEPVPMEMEVEEEKNDFFRGAGASAWTGFKLDTSGMLMPWARRRHSEDEDNC